jgi:Family of unknown function (DUF6519)
MEGDFKGDFTRDTFDPLRRFSRVLMQQGRVQLDADWNEQADLLLYAQRRLITNLVGPHWGTFDFVVKSDGSGIDHIDPNSFKIVQLQGNPADFSIGAGNYYVDGIPAVNVQVDPKQPLTYTQQTPQPGPLGNNRYWVYLDVWEQQVTYLGDDTIREIALGENGPDTATRAEIVWQIKASTVPAIPTDVFDRFGSKGTDAQNPLLKIQFIEDSTQLLVKTLQPPFRGAIKARGRAPADNTADPCITPPNSQFRGDENQLYRVEIHSGGTQETATFKWSRENGSVVFPIVSLAGNTVTLGNLGRDSHLSLGAGDWVEIVDDDSLLQVASLQGPGSTNPPQGTINPLLQVDTVDRMNLLVTLKGTPSSSVGQDPKKHPLLRCWDQKSGTGQLGDRPKLAKDGTISIKEGTTDTSWIILEDGVQIQFQPSGKTADKPPQDNPAMMYRTGDYWLIPARTVTGDVLWPQENAPSGVPYPSGHPQALPPRGVKHHYALLAIVSFARNDPDAAIDLRYMVPPLGKLALIFDMAAFTQFGL